MGFCTAFISNCVEYSASVDANGHKLCAKCFNSYNATNPNSAYTNNFILSSD